MLYATATFWLLLMVLLAYGVHRLWGGMVKPKTVNAILLPGTAVARLGHIVALLITGATAGGGNGKDGAPAAKSKIPVIGPVFTALLPIAALAVVIFLAVSRLGAPVLAKLPPDKLGTELPASLTAFWDQLVALIRLAEGCINAVRDAELVNWQLALFVYLLVCLTVQMAPFPGNLRGYVGAVLAIGVLAWLAGSVATTLPDQIRAVWPMLALSLGCLILLLMVSLLVRAAVTATRTVMYGDS